MMITTNQIDNEILRTKDLIKNNNAEINKLPSGHLFVQKRGERLAYTRAVGKKRKGINKDTKLVRELARKEFLTQKHSILKSNLWQLEQFSKHYSMDPDGKAIETMRKSLQQVPKHFFLRESSLPAIKSEYQNEIYRILGWNDYVSDKSITDKPFVLTTKMVCDLSNSDEGKELLKHPEIREFWGKCPYKEYDGYSQHKNKPTKRGFVRSKGEQMIVALLLQNRIPFHYDEVLPPELNLNNIVPDFIYISLFGSLICHEHFGMMNKPEYQERYHKKIKEYEGVGLVPWENLIVTFDVGDGILDPTLVLTQIKSMLGYQL